MRGCCLPSVIVPDFDGVALCAMQSEDLSHLVQPPPNIVEKVMLPRRQGYGRIQTQARRGEQPFPSLTSAVSSSRGEIGSSILPLIFLFEVLFVCFMVGGMIILFIPVKQSANTVFFTLVCGINPSCRSRSAVASGEHCGTKATMSMTPFGLSGLGGDEG